MKSLVFVIAYLSAMIFPASHAEAQGIVTADQFLQSVSRQYGSVRDYEASIAIRSGNTTMQGNTSYLAPSSMRIDFSQPANQVILFSGGTLTVYLPDLRVVLSQEIGQNPGAAGASIASSDGLSLLRRNYVSAFVTGPDAVSLDANSREQVVKLRLTRRNSSEAFREIILSVNPETLLIRRIEATAMTGVSTRFDFTNIKVNQGIPELRFVYSPPAGSNTIHNFMFRNAN